jgi:polyisoprenoid-binding protein YceI
MKKLILIATAIFLFANAFAQKKYFTKTGNVSFSAGTAIENIDGTNKSTTCVFDAATGNIQFAILVKGFEFKSALMMEHFNENYMESDKYPKSLFTGKITNIDKVNFQKDGSYPVTVKGTLEIHGVKKDVETNGTFKVAGETVLTTADFNVLLEDYKIEIPGLVKDKISKTAKIQVNCANTILK